MYLFKINVNGSSIINGARDKTFYTVHNGFGHQVAFDFVDFSQGYFMVGVFQQRRIVVKMVGNCLFFIHHQIYHICARFHLFLIIQFSIYGDINAPENRIAEPRLERGCFFRNFFCLWNFFYFWFIYFGRHFLPHIWRQHIRFQVR